MTKKNYSLVKLIVLAKLFIVTLVLFGFYGCAEQNRNEKKVIDKLQSKDKFDTVEEAIIRDKPLLNTNSLPENEVSVTLRNTEYNNYKQGEKIGLRKEFYENGQIKSEGVFKAEKKEGLHKEWQSNGVLILEGYYENGIANGIMKWYHDKGFLAGVGLMKNGERHGVWKVYAIEDGKLAAEVKFKEGKQQEVLKTYDSTDQ